MRLPAPVLSWFAPGNDEPAGTGISYEEARLRVLDHARRAHLYT